MRYVVFDVETPNWSNDRMSAIGIVIVEDGKVMQRFFSLVNPETHFDRFNMELTGITPRMVADAPTFSQLWPQLQPLLESGTLVAHNAPFDMAVLGKCLQHYGIVWQKTALYLCTCRLAKRALPMLCNYKLDTLCNHYAISLQHHQADSDALACARLLLELEKILPAQTVLRRYDLQNLRTLALPKSLDSHC